MSKKQEYTFEKERPYDFWDLGKWFLFAILLMTCYLVQHCEADKPETRHIPTYNDYNRLNSVSNNEHCR